MFKSLNFLKLDAERFNALFDSEDKFQACIEAKRFKPLGSLDMARIGLSSRTGEYTKEFNLLDSFQGQWMITLRSDARMLPGAVVKAKVKEEVERFEKANRHKPARKEVKEIKERVILELIPRAFIKTTLTHVWIDPVNGTLATTGKADDVASTLIACESSMPIEIFDFVTVTPHGLMTKIIHNEEGTQSVPGMESFAIDDECELKHGVESHQIVKYTHLSLDRDDIKKQIEEGRFVTKLAMTYDDAISFVLNDKFEFKKINFIGQDDEDSNEGDDEMDAEMQFEKEFFIATETLRPMLADLRAVLEV